ncbi:MAG: CocE/NonD family hydrolase, partial [Gammaproteobacteria bacterium]
VVEQNVMIPMRDGVRLATDIYRPARGGAPVTEKLPVLLQRTPYDKSGGRLREQAQLFARHGYIVALQDCRGRYKSEGVFSKYIGEGVDGHDAIEWLARLPDADGQVGMWGTSYAAHVQAGAAKTKPPHLKTIVLNMGGFYNGWDHKIRNHGAFENQQLTWAFSQLAAETADPRVRELLKQENPRDWLAGLPFRKGLNPLSIVPSFEDQILEMMTHGDYDDYWKHPDINWAEHYDRTADIPMIHVSGWYDSYCGGTIKNYAELAKLQKSPSRLLIGPWTHGGNTRSFAGDVEFGPDAVAADFNEGFHLRWFDHFLKSRAWNPGDDAAIRVFVMGGGSGHRLTNGRMFHGGAWRTGTRWPLPGTQFTSYYFHSDGALRREKPPAGSIA